MKAAVLELNFFMFNAERMRPTPSYFAMLDNANLIEAPGYALTNLNVHYDGAVRAGAIKSMHLLFEIRNLSDKVWVASAGNLANSLNAATGELNGVAVLANAGGMYAGAPRSFFTGVRLGF